MSTCHEHGSAHGSSEQKAFRTLVFKSLLAAMAGIPLLIWSYVGTREIMPGTSQIIWIIVGIITLVIMCYSGGHFFTGAWQSFKAHQANMFTLIAVATAPAWIYSMLIAIWPTLVPAAARDAHFDAPLTIIALIVMGAAFEMKASAKSQARTNQLARLKPTQALRIEEGDSTQVAIKHIAVGNVVEIPVGEIVSVDGDIVSGESSVDESIFSADLSNVSKKTGDFVYAGSRNLSAKLEVRVKRSGGDIALEKVVDILKQAQNTRPSIGDIADKIAAYFAPIVLIAAIITPLLWFDMGPRPQVLYMLVTFMAVLLIACPCALGLATPISIATGVSKASDFGAIFRTGDAVQTSSKLSCLVIDEACLYAPGEQSIRADVSAAVMALHKLKIPLILFSSHHTETAKSLVDELNIQQVYTEMSVADKVRIIEELQAKGDTVGFVATGEEDEPLAAADVAYTLGMSAYQSKQGDVIIMGGSLFSVVDTLRVSKSILRNIKQNLSGAFIYNIAGIPLAAGILYPFIHTLLSPIVAGALMACSSLGVVLNANRLLLFKASKRS